MTLGKVNVLRVNDHEIYENLPTDICFLAHILSVCLDHLQEKILLKSNVWMQMLCAGGDGFTSFLHKEHPIPDVTNAVI
jgi:hypothetical protein